MKTLRTPFVFGLVIAIMLTMLSGFVLLDAFVIARGIPIVDQPLTPC